MAAVFCWFVVALVLGCAVVWFTRGRKIACWLLVVFPAAICLGLGLDLAHGVVKLGEASYRSYLRTLPYAAGFLVMALAAAFRPKWGWLFWVTWLFSALVCVVVVYLTFFWKVFS